MAFSAASFWMIFINTTALLAAMWDTKSNIEKMEKNEKKWKKLLTNKKNDGIINLAVEETP